MTITNDQNLLGSYHSSLKKEFSVKKKSKTVSVKLFSWNSLAQEPTVFQTGS